jgi:hypothetical protein
MAGSGPKDVHVVAMVAEVYHPPNLLPRIFSCQTMATCILAEEVTIAII